MNDDIEGARAIFNQASKNFTTSAGLQAVELVNNTSRYDDFLEISKNHDKFFISTGLKELDDIIGGWSVNDDLVTICARNGIGKCLEKGTKVLMADGSLKKVEDVKIGDKVQSLNAINTVIGCHNGRSKGYKIIPTLGDPFVVSENHILTLMKRNQILNKNGIFHTTDNTFTLCDMMIEDYLNLSPNQQRQYELYRPSVEYSEKDLKIPPYILGLWLGDGTSCRPELTSIDEELIKEWTEYAETNNCIARKHSNVGAKVSSYDITSGKKAGHNPILKTFREYNLLKNKHIPLDYLTGSKKQRLELLAGIIDTDGYLSKKYRSKSDTYICVYSLCLKNKALVEQVAQLARGLNFRVGSIAERKLKLPSGKDGFYYTISINGDVSQIPCRLDRKKAVKSSSERVLNLCNFTIEEIPEIEYCGFMTDGDHRFLLWDNTLTHNTWLMLKFAAAAALAGKRVGIYSGEMSEDSVGYRLDTLIGNLPNGSLVHGNESVKGRYKQYIENLPSRVPGKVYVITPKQLNGSASVSILKAFIHKYDLEILFVDQHSLMKDDRKARDRVERANNISEDLKILQSTEHIPIVACAQQNREKVENGFDTTQIANSDRIGQDSSVILFIEKKDELIKIHGVKVRQGQSNFILTYKCDLNTGNFVYIPSEKDMQGNAAITTSGSYSQDDVF